MKITKPINYLTDQQVGTFSSWNMKETRFFIFQDIFNHQQDILLRT